VNGSAGGFKVPRTDWCFGKIYTSECSAKILLARFPFLRPYTVPLRFLTEYEIRGRSVWLIPANHCPGAALFLFRTAEGRVLLHTGDFRFRQQILDDLRLCMPEKPSLQVDWLYLDNTFGTSDEAFPSQQVAYHQLSELILSHRRRNPALKFFLYCYTLGKEEVFWNLAEQFNTKVQMLKERFDKTACCGLGQSHFITKQEHDMVRDGPIFIFVRNMRDLPKTAAEVEKTKDTIHIVLSGWKGQYNVRHPRYFKILYSSHSSPSELETWVKEVNPDNLVFLLDQKPDAHRQSWQLRIQTKFTKRGQLATQCLEKGSPEAALVKSAGSTQSKLNFKPSVAEPDNFQSETQEQARSNPVAAHYQFVEIDDILKDPSRRKRQVTG